jgi:hypothetical protein
MAISDLSPNISVDLVLHGHGVDVTGRLVSPIAGYRTCLPVTWADLRRNPELLTTPCSPPRWDGAHRDAV